MLSGRLFDVYGMAIDSAGNLMSTATVKERRQFSNFSSHSERQCRSYPNDLGRIDAGLHWGHRGRHGREYLSQHDDQLRYSTGNEVLTHRIWQCGV